MQNYQKLSGKEWTPEDVTAALSLEGEDAEKLMVAAGKVRSETIGDGVYLRGLIEYSNVCRKDCFYCGIRCSGGVERYTLTENDVLDCARQAHEGRYGSVVIQAGENTSDEHAKTIARLVRRIKEMSDGALGITLSLGEQHADVYKEWFSAGAHRYLLRIETSDPALYAKLHPANDTHSYERRMGALGDLHRCGYQVGTGVMIGLPGQSVESLARDIIFMRGMDIDMCGMGPYVESAGTPLAEAPFAPIPPPGWRFDMALKMVAVLRLVMPDVNIAATTALQAIDPLGRIRAIGAGANVIMPNLTPASYRENYFLYDNKPLSLDSKVLESDIRYGEWGDSHRFRARRK